MCAKKGGICVTIGDLIKQKRKNANLTQEALAKKVGCATITIRQYESGKRSPNLNILDAISKALNVDLFDLVPDEPERVDRFSFLSDEQKAFVLDTVGSNETLKAFISIFIQLPDDSKILLLKEMKRLEKETEEERHAIDQKKDK